MNEAPRIVVIAGPTASGKSALAMAVAARFGGTVVNADSMQVYRELRILSARPSVADEALVPHDLYGVLSADQRGTAETWRTMAQAAITRSVAAGRLPVLVGGTGLYFRALLQGLSPIPAIPDDLRARTRDRILALGAPALHAALAVCDPVMAARLQPGDSHRIARAWDVLAHTGRSLADWQTLPGRGHAGPALVLTLDPPARALADRMDTRFLAMVAEGALDEVRHFATLSIPPDASVRTAHGLPELLVHVAGRMTLEDAIRIGQANTRAYAKRQRTWFRHQLSSNLVLSEPLWEKDSERLTARIFSLIDEFLLTASGPGTSFRAT